MAFTGQRIIEQDVAGFETTNGTIASAWTKTLTANGVYTVTVEMIAKDTTSGKSIKGIKTTTFERIAGVTTQVATSLIDLAATLISDAVNNAGATWTIDNSTDDIRVRVTGNIGRTIHWMSKITIVIN
jgi:hypothetical protein